MQKPQEYSEALVFCWTKVSRFELTMESYRIKLQNFTDFQEISQIELVFIHSQKGNESE